MNESAQGFFEHIKKRDEELAEMPPEIKERYEHDEKLGQELVDAGIITKFENYKDPYKFAMTPQELIERLDPGTQQSIYILTTLVQGPFLYDDIEDNADGKNPDEPVERAEIKNKIHRQFPYSEEYYGLNKFNASNIAHGFVEISELDAKNPLPAPLMVEYAALHDAFYSGVETRKKPAYKYAFRNGDKYPIGKRVSMLEEQVIKTVLDRAREN